MNAGWEQRLAILRRDAEGKLLEPLHTHCGEGGRTNMTAQPSTGSELSCYQTEDGQTRIQCRFEGKLSIRPVERTALEVP